MAPYVFIYLGADPKLRLKMIYYIDCTVNNYLMAQFHIAYCIALYRSNSGYVCTKLFHTLNSLLRSNGVNNRLGKVMVTCITKLMAKYKSHAD